MPIPDKEIPVLAPTNLLHPSLPSWIQINLDDKETDVRTRIQGLIRDVPRPWRSVDLVSPTVVILVMDVLQKAC